MTLSNSVPTPPSAPSTGTDPALSAAAAATAASTAATAASTAAKNAIIVCDNLVKIYKVAELEVFALQGLDLVVKPGELLGIIGASGSGKSTLMNILGGLDRPSAGRVWVDGMNLLDLSDAELDRYRRTMVGFVWQQGGRNLIPYLDAQENVELPMTLAGVAGYEKRQRAAELLDAVGLSHRRTHHLSEMSGGEQQRVAIAVALANSPHLLLADEPTGELDSVTALSIYQTFKELNQRYGLTMIMVSHDPTISRHMDRVIAIRDGKMSTETVRQARPATNGAAGEAAAPGNGGSGAAEAEDEMELQELIVLDSAGRLQIPKDYLKQVNIKSRVILEVTEDGIFIRPAGGDAGHGASSAEALGAALADNKRTNKPDSGTGRLLNRIRRVMNPNRRKEG